MATIAGHLDSFVRELAPRVTHALRMSPASAAAADWATAAGRASAWCQALLDADGNRTASVFLLAVRTQVIEATATWACGFYRSTAMGLRCVLDLTQAWTYYRSHPIELAAVLADPRRFLSRREIEQFHEDFTPAFRDRWNEIGLKEHLNRLYGQLSQILHAQHPAAMATATGPTSFGFQAAVAKDIAVNLAEVETAARRFAWLASPDLWAALDHHTKESLVSGIPKKQPARMGVRP